MNRGRPRIPDEQLTPEGREKKFKEQWKADNYKPKISVCYYCEQTAETVYQFAQNSKRIGNRGRNLEVERKDPNKKYNELEDGKPINLALACYICNNAKSDFPFTEEEFKPIADAIKTAVEKYLEKQKNDIQTS